MPLINYHSAVLTLKSVLSFKLLSFLFLLKETLTLLIQYISKRKMILENIVIEKVKRTCRNLNSFNFQQFLIFMKRQYCMPSGLSQQRRFCQLQINSPVMAFLYIHKLKINAKLQEKSLVRDINPPCTYCKLCQSRS